MPCAALAAGQAYAEGRLSIDDVGALLGMVATWILLVETILTLARRSYGTLLPRPTGHPDQEALAA